MSNQPFWSVMIPTYKGEMYLGDTLRSVVVATEHVRNVQIAVVDDASDSTEIPGIVKRIGRSKIQYVLRTRNGGISKNFNTCIQKSKGKWVHILHDDDMVFPAFYDEINKYIDENPDVDCVFCRTVIISDRGRWLTLSVLPNGLINKDADFDLASALLNSNFICSPSVAVRKSFYDRFGGFNRQLSHTADWEMWLRIACLGKIGYVDKPLALYRLREGSDTSSATLTGENVRQMKMAIDFVLKYFPENSRRRKKDDAYNQIGHTAFLAAKKFYIRRNYKSALIQSIWATRLINNYASILKPIILSIVSFLRLYVG